MASSAIAAGRATAGNQLKRENHDVTRGERTRLIEWLNIAEVTDWAQRAEAESACSIYCRDAR